MSLDICLSKYILLKSTHCNVVGHLCYGCKEGQPKQGQIYELYFSTMDSVRSEHYFLFILHEKLIKKVHYTLVLGPS